VSRLTTEDNPAGYTSHNISRSIEDVDYDAYTAIQNAGCHHLGCAEIGCISDAFEAGDSMENAAMESVHFAPGTPYHLTPVAPCPATRECSTARWWSGESRGEVADLGTEFGRSSRVPASPMGYGDLKVIEAYRFLCSVADGVPPCWPTRSAVPKLSTQ
jgi:hypothetical protein